MYAKQYLDAGGCIVRHPGCNGVLAAGGVHKPDNLWFFFQVEVMSLGFDVQGVYDGLLEPVAGVPGGT